MPLTQSEIGRMYDVDNEGYTRLALNGLLLLEGDHIVLIDPGCADFLPSRIMKEYALELPESIESILLQKGLSPHQVTDVIFTHLHFDHGSGAFERQPGKIVKRFPNARYHVLKEHYDYAMNPHPSETNSFFTGLLKYLDKIHWLEDWEEGWMKFRVFNGHTRGMVVPVIKAEHEEIVYLTDLVPMKIFLEKGVYSAYDQDHKLAVKEKDDYLNSRETPTRCILYHEPLTYSIYYP